MASEKNTIARPYARAAFDYALAQQGLPVWSTWLTFAGLLVTDEEMIACLKNPSFRPQQQIDLFIDLCGEQLDQAGKNFLQQLAKQKRLLLLPEIADLFLQMRAVHDKTQKVQVASSYPLTEAMQEKLKAALRKRLNKDIELECQQDESLLGGLLIRAGDLVIDGSLKGRVAQLAEEIV